MKKTPQVSAPDSGTFLVLCRDGDHTASLRKTYLDEHLAHMEQNYADYRLAGPMGENPTPPYSGSLFLVAADTENQARAIMEGDPYIRHQIYASISIQRVHPLCGSWLGGVTWETSAD